MVFTHFYDPSAARTVLGSIIGSEAMSPYPFLSICVCVCVCVFLTNGIFDKISDLQCVQITSCLPNATAYMTLKSYDICGLVAESSWPLQLKPHAYRGIFFSIVHFQTTNTAGTHGRFVDFQLSLVPNLSMTYIKLF